MNFLKSLTTRGALALMLSVAMLLVGIPTPAAIAQTRNTNQTPPNPATTLTQTTLSTTLGSATTMSDPGHFGGAQVVVASATGFVAGYRMYILSGGIGEAMDITNVSGTTITVVRGVAGTHRQPHLSGDVVFVQRAALFQSQDPDGTCSTAASPTPWVNIPQGNIWYCGADLQWHQTLHQGVTTGAAGGLHPITYTALGALSVVPGLHLINGTTLAMTLAAPTKDQDGMIMIIVSQNASAQTVTYTAGFSQNTTSSDVATFGGAVNDNMVIVARAGVWQVISTRNVTIA